MPTHDYLCLDCGEAFERLVRADTQIACPRCAGSHLERRLSVVSPPGKSATIKAAARAQARREGHLSNE